MSEFNDRRRLVKTIVVLQLEKKIGRRIWGWQLRKKPSDIPWNFTTQGWLNLLRQTDIQLNSVENYTRVKISSQDAQLLLQKSINCSIDLIAERSLGGYEEHIDSESNLDIENEDIGPSISVREFDDDQLIESELHTDFGIVTGYIEPKCIGVDVHYATDRVPTGVDDVNYRYGSEFGELVYGRMTVSVPLSHELGHLERPFRFWIFGGRENEEKHITLQEITELEKVEFFVDLRADVESSEDNSVFIFIHGFNVTFAGAARRVAQMAYDLFLVGTESSEAVLSCVPVLYSWPSKGKAILYDHDEESVEASAKHLKEFIYDICHQVNANRLVIVAHSMGNRALIYALRDIGMTMQEGSKPLVRDIVLAAPDISKVVFENSAEAVLKTSQRTTLYASSNDLPLKLSIKANGFPRLGETSDGILITKLLDSIDASATGSDVLAHSYVGETTVMRDMYEMIKHDKSPDQRFGLLGVGKPPNKYWSIRR